MKPRLPTVALALASGAICLLVAEWVVARAGVLEYPPSMTRGHPTRGYTLRPGFAGATGLGVPLVVNSLGLRSPEVATPKPAGTRRVLVLGDSVTFGAGVPEEQGFPRQLEARLRSELDCPVEVVNAGVSGYGTVEEADLFEEAGLALAPDVVILLHVENDNIAVPHVQGRIAAFLKDEIVYRSHLVGAALLALRRARWMLQAADSGGDTAAFSAEMNHWDQRSGTAASLDALARIATLAQQHGAKAILASYPATPRDPSLDAVRHRILRAAAADRGMVFVETGPALAAHFDRGLAVSAQDLHPNGYAHGLIAEALRAAVADALACPPRSAEHS